MVITRKERRVPQYPTSDPKLLVTVSVFLASELASFFSNQTLGPTSDIPVLVKTGQIPHIVTMRILFVGYILTKIMLKLLITQSPLIKEPPKIIQ